MKRPSVCQMRPLSRKNCHLPAWPCVRFHRAASPQLPWACLCAAVAVFLLQAWACRLWLALFLYGPLEWLWRTATMCRMQPFRKRMP